MVEKKKETEKTKKKEIISLPRLDLEHPMMDLQKHDKIAPGLLRRAERIYEVFKEDDNVHSRWEPIMMTVFGFEVIFPDDFDDKEWYDQNFKYDMHTAIGKNDARQICNRLGYMNYHHLTIRSFGEWRLRFEVEADGNPDGTEVYHALIHQEILDGNELRMRVGV